MAMQVPLGPLWVDLPYFRKLWKQPKAEYGDWIIKPIAGGMGPSHILVKNERFNQKYREPY